MSEPRFYVRVVLTEQGKPEQLLILDSSPHGKPIFLKPVDGEALYNDLGAALEEFSDLLREWKAPA